MSILSVTNIRKRFDDRYALHSISFELGEGEVLCFLGPSGCGKTTLLRIIAGLESDYSGDVCFDGQTINAVPAHKRNFGMMFQDYALFPHLSVADNVAFGLQFKQMSAEQTAARVQEMLELVGLEEFAARPVGELSGGERQRVALARSLAPQPRLLMLDEPLAALDRALRERLARDLRTILKEVGVTAIFVTHDQSEAFAIADKVAVFHDGNLEQLADPVSLYTRPASETVARFLGFRNLLPVTQISEDTIQTPIGSLPIKSTSALLSPVTSQTASTTAPNFASSVASNAACHVACHVAPDAAHASRDTSDTAAVPTTMLIRPEGATLIPQADTPQRPAQPLLSGETIHLTGTVTERTFIGQTYQVSVSMGEYTSLRFFLPIASMPPETGSSATIAVPLSSFVLLGNS